MRLLIAENESLDAREARRAHVGRSNGESYRACLEGLAPGAAIDLVRPAEPGSEGFDPAAYDAVFLTGSPMHLYELTAEVRQVIDFMRTVFRSGTPSFGSCAGLQVAVVAAGGTVRANRVGHEAAFARRITATAAGRSHPLLAGRPAAWDALTIHSDEVERLPEGTVALAGNTVVAVQAAEVRLDGGVFWGTQYHPELPLDEVAVAVRRQAEDLVGDGLGDEAAVSAYADAIEALGREPARRDLAWRLGVDSQVTDPALRTTELRNFLGTLVRPGMGARGRG